MDMMMLSEHVRSKPTFLETQQRTRRLADIKRGKQFFQKIDSLAKKQWIRNTPRDSAESRQIVTIRPLTDTQHTKSKYKHMFKNDIENKRVHSERPRPPERMVADDTPLVDSTTPRQNVQLDIRNPYFRNDYAEKIGERLGVYNKWGSGVHPLDEKVALTDNDLAPMFEPFRFRDSIKHVFKPTPKHYMPMSRAGHEKDRVLKVHTNFLSRNGVVDIIPELEQWPEIEDESLQQSFIQDPNLLQKEKTSVFMNRVNKMIDPYKQRTDNMEITSSDEECKGSPSASISDLSEINKMYPRSSKNRDVGIVQKLPLYPKYITQPQRTQCKNLTFSKLLMELNRQPMVASRKCKIWVNNLERIDLKNCKT
jgi:hypothetical protein